MQPKTPQSLSTPISLRQNQAFAFWSSARKKTGPSHANAGSFSRTPRPRANPASQEPKNLLNCKPILSQPSRTHRHLDDVIFLSSEELVRCNDLIERERVRQQRPQNPTARAAPVPSTGACVLSRPN